MAGEEFSEEYSEKQISEFNEAVFQIQRLNGLWIECKIRRQNGDLNGLRYALDTASVELWNDAKRLSDKDQKEDFILKLNVLDKEIEKEIDCKNKESLKKLYHLFIEKEKLLRELQESAGKGGKLRPEEEDHLL